MTTRALEKITVVVAVVVLGVALAVNVGLPHILPLIGALVITVSAGLDIVLRGEARYRPTPDLFILPAALVIGAVLFLHHLASGATIVAGLTVFSLLLFAVFWAEHGLRVGRAEPRLAATVLSVVGYVAAFTLYAAIYQAKARTLISAPAIVMSTFLLATRQFRLAHEAAGDDPSAPVASGPRPGADAGAAGVATLTGSPTTPGAPSPPAAPSTAAAPWPRTLLYAAVAALATGELTWALNYWPLNGLFGGAFLLSGFFFFVGILSHHLQDRLNRRLVAEYGVVALAGTLLIAFAGLLRRGM
jgi:hypothetical protein